MAVKRISAETLIELAVETLRSELQPNLPPEQRYTVAMIANALEIARREILTDGETARWELLDELYPDGDGNLRRLAEDIRSSAVNAVKTPRLHEHLRAILVEELSIRNPRFLKTRQDREQPG